MVEKRKRKKTRQLLTLKEKQTESESFKELIRLLEELEDEGEYVDIQICPRCKSPRVRRVGTLSGDMSSHIGILPVKFECIDCGWRERLVLKATNKRLSWREVAIMAEARASAD
jgi:RNase P subunit RPR2